MYQCEYCDNWFDEELDFPEHLNGSRICTYCHEDITDTGHDLRDSGILFGYEDNEYDEDY